MKGPVGLALDARNCFDGIKEVIVLGSEEHGICYGVKRGNASRSGTTQKPTNTNTKSTPTQKHKSHVLIV